MAWAKKPDPTLILFGAMNGSLYADNSRHLYEWVLLHHQNWRPVWVTRSKKVYNNLRGKAKPVVLMQSWYGIQYLAKASIGIFTHSLRDLAIVPSLIPDTLRLIALRHGKSVKRVRFARLKHKITEQEIIERQRESNLIRYIISTSEFISDIQEECLQIGRHKHVTIGYPRNDALLSPTREMRILWEEYLNGLNPQKVVLYAPSWRHGREPTRFFPFADFEKTALNDFLNKRGILLLLRPHVNDLLRYPNLRNFLEDLATANDVIRFASHEVFPDINMILPYVDVLVSDYSGLYHDFLLLDRPLIFIPYDYENFKEQNGFLYDYYENLPGPAINSFKDFCVHVGEICRGKDPYLGKRRKLTDKIHTYKDADSCKRLTTLIDRILLEK